ncbi:glycosyltransferase family 39 protein [Undibacterium umbellatum]|uniref:Glycosyltransferase family 39 protein n=1 Tax=Undibacterium umbellatum TaxID=2762300 RepID=A0ABR6Z2R1_9BURK|nr:glycosyltransferase family 39 protein [Undibacterium umbellatum]MBC3906043.1 glycosyltransferase family 39 protein [Undibacterium umbellatum]
MNKTSPYDSPRTLWALTIAFLLIWFYMLGARTLVPTDEGRYAQMGREMLASGDWITLRLNGIKYFEKPPLQNWMNALTFAVFGLGDWQARLWTGLNGLLGVAAVAYTGNKIFNRRTGIIAALVLGSSFWWAGMGHVNSLDMGLSGMMTLVLCGLLVAQMAGVNSKTERNAMLVCWAGMALATMSKGLIGFVLPGAVLVIYTIVTRDWGLWKRLHMGKGLILFFAITAPWFILIAIKNPEHPHFFFIHEHFDRFTSTVHKRGGPWHYFIPLLIVGIVPWIGVLLQGLWSGVKDNTPGFQPRKMLFIWAAFLFFFFSISGSKLPGYILPIFPALALLIACHLEQNDSRPVKVAGILFILVGAAGAIGLAVYLSKLDSADTFDRTLAIGYTPWIVGIIALAMVGGLLTWLLARKGTIGKDWAIICLAASGYLVGQVAFLGHNPWGKYIAGSEYLPAIKAELTSPTTPFYAVGRYEQALPFYLERTVTLVEFPDEMQFGLHQQPELWIPKREDFIAKWQAHQDKGETAVAILRNDIYEDLKKTDFPMRLIAKDPRRVIVANLVNKNK